MPGAGHRTGTRARNANALERSPISPRTNLAMPHHPRLRGGMPAASRDMLCLLLVACLRHALVATRLRRPICYNAGSARDRRQNRDSRKKRKRVGKIAQMYRGRFLLKAIFQVWRGQIPEKSSKNSPFPLGVEGLWCRDRPQATSPGSKRSGTYQ